VIVFSFNPLLPLPIVRFIRKCQIHLSNWMTSGLNSFLENLGFILDLIF